MIGKQIEIDHVVIDFIYNANIVNVFVGSHTDLT